MDYLQLFFISLFFTIAAETLALFILVRNVFRLTARQSPDCLLIFAGILTSACTLPYVWFVLPSLFSSWMLYAFAAETFAVLAEGAIYLVLLRLKWREAFLLSLACNMFSFALGLLLFGG